MIFSSNQKLHKNHFSKFSLAKTLDLSSQGLLKKFLSEFKVVAIKTFMQFINKINTRFRRHFLVSVRNPECLYGLESDPFSSLTSPTQCQVQFLKICKLIILESSNSYYEFQTSNDSSPKKYKFFDRKLFIFVFMFRKMNHKWNSFFKHISILYTGFTQCATTPLEKSVALLHFWGLHIISV